jgi:predicted nucleic acid-binding protein
MLPTSEPPTADASPLIYLARIGRFDLLQLAGRRLIVPEVVLAEVRRGVPEEPAVRAVASANWIEIVAARDPPAEFARHGLGLGESAVIVWALDHPGTLAIIDEQAGRHMAERLGIPVVGTLALVVQAKRRGLVPNAGSVIEDLRRAGMYLSDRIIDRARTQAGEL